MELKDKMAKYWITLYPEAPQKDKIDGFLKNAWGEGIDELLNRVQNNRFYNKEDVLKMIEDIFLLPMNKEMFEFEKRCKSSISYYNFFRPIVNYCFWKYYDRITALNSKVSFDCVMMNTLEEISRYAIKFLVLDVNYMKNAGKLIGADHEEKFRYYEETILSDVSMLRELYDNYYEFVRLAMKMTEHCFAYCEEIIRNFYKDKEELKKKLGISKNDDIDIVSIKIGSGDKHNGKSVARVLLSNEMQVLYKPHSLELDRNFSEFIKWIDYKKNDDMLDLKAAECISSNSYSWAFFVKHDEVKTKSGIGRFFYRAGQMLGIMYMLNGVDCHYENIIADGEYPVLIDTETLMHPVIKGRENGNNASEDLIGKSAREHMFESTLSTGLLPYFILGNEEGAERVDVGGLSSVADCKYPYKSIDFVKANSDEVKLKRVYHDIPEAFNCPSYKGKIYEGIEYKDEIIKGFTAIYKWVLENREEVLDYIRDNFKDTTVRIIMRATSIYGRLLETSIHPDFLSDDISRRVLLSRISINATKEYLSIVPHECESLVDNDVPYFTCKLGGKDVKCNGHIIAGMIKESPVDAVEKKILKFSNRDMMQQIHYIEDSYRLKESTYESDISGVVFSDALQEISNKEISSNDTYIDFAKKVADYLIDYSIEMDIEGEKCRGWLTSFLKGNCDKLCEMGFASYNMYAGITGIGMFLSELAKLTGIERYVDATKDCLSAVRYKVNMLGNEKRINLGSYNGVSGYLLFMYDANKLFQDPEIDKEIDGMLDIIGKRVDDTDFYDVMQGDAGGIQVLNYIYRDGIGYQKKVLEIIKAIVRKMSDRLFSSDKDEINWIGTDDISRYSGYAHGVAGIIAQLAKVRDILDTKKIDKMIGAMLTYERSFYCMEKENWFTNTDMDQIGNGWCHGSPGILLEKVFLKKSGYTDELLDKEFDIALKRTIELSIGCTHCYCHGDIGNIDIIGAAADVMGDESLKKRCLATYDVTFDKNLTRLYNGRAFRGGDVVGLMLGSTGFGYSALRCAASEKVKSILAF